MAKIIISMISVDVKLRKGHAKFRPRQRCVDQIIYTEHHRTVYKMAAIKYYFLNLI